MQELSSVDRVAASMCVVPAFVCVSVACVAAVVIKTLGTESGDCPLECPLAGFSALAALTVVTLLFFTLQALERAWYVASIVATKYRSFAAVIAWWLSLERNRTKVASEDGHVIPVGCTDGSFHRSIDPKEPDPRPCKGNSRLRVGSMLWLLDVTDSVAHQRELCKNSILS
ncbi:hypothetical protein ACIS_00087 [Anaplasma centrale str. Israel]|uniref:Uncharacterized protein n=1 Tax=Anaplasma centrale (strain Israel) TaxID=574556 RepID=D1ATB3_ANACI|nr:hypothetical protein [Anaplasma centrale]ACZ48791.1 hypothetical protein ACIS_00087 [Anaplasma centrale str. Israel]